ncbi:phosphatase PAP2 family protein [Candidatus Parcubacteria bacterium]|jgi:undecaprenyl-diphosphatase|nr:MAG: phosphatase PAP2 family protein [Candidatus Parcubacteria bacterium]
MFDLGIFQFISEFANRSALADWFVVVIAEYLPYLAGIIAIILWIRIPAWRERMRLFIIITFSLLIARGFIFEIIHYFYSRPRPFIALQITPLFIETSYAFPSSHAIVLTILGCVVYMISKRWGIIFLLFACINALARIYSGVHWPTDSLGGIVIALIAVVIAIKVFPKDSYLLPEKDSETDN